jgi:hypothetical protein
MYVGKHRKPVAHPVRNRLIVSATVTALTLGGGAALGTGVASAEPIVSVASVTPLQTVEHHDNDRNGRRGQIVRGDNHRRGPVFHHPVLRHRGWWENRCHKIRTFDRQHHRFVLRNSCSRLWHR